MLQEKTEHINKATANESVISIKNLYKSFGSNHVLSDFSLDVPKGQSIDVLGKSNSGKSVLIKCIIGLMPPNSSSIHVLGKNIPDLNNIELDKIQVKVGFLFQSNALYDSNLKRYVPCAMPSVQFFPNLGVKYRIVQSCNWMEVYRKLP